jgi:hypothetical protein
VGGDAIQNRTHLYSNAVWRKIGLKDRRTLRLGKDRLLKRLADLPPIDIKGRNSANVLKAVAADGFMHQAGSFSGSVGAVVLDSLQKRAGAITHTRNGKMNGLHEVISFG